MKTRLICIAAGAALLGSALRAQDIAGVWEGTIRAGGDPYRQLMKIAKTETGWSAICYSLDEEAEPVAATSVELTGANLTVIFPPNTLGPTDARYAGTLGRDGRSIAGTWIQPEGRYPLTFRRATAREAWAVPAAHTIRFVTVDSNVKLEVLDWGGSGRPLVFLAGLGASAHDFNWFAPKFTPTYHVYAITRRGFGASSAPAFTNANYRADRLGDDVLAVIDSLGLRHPVLVGHSIAGEELSSIGSRHPEKVAGLIYLDAGYSYAFYDGAHGIFEVDRQDLVHALEQLQLGQLSGSDRRALIDALRDSIVPRFQRAVDQEAKLVDAMPPRVLNRQAVDTTPSAARAMLEGTERYTSIPVPILAIFALPHQTEATPGPDSAAVARWEAQFDSSNAVQVTAFERGVPTARVVRMANATHFVYRSREADVLREMRTFLASLAQQ